MNDLLSAITIAFSTQEKSGSMRDDVNQQAVSIEARKAERAFTIAVKRLARIIRIAAPLDLSTNIRQFEGLLQLAVKLELLHHKLGMFEFEVCKRNLQVSDKSTQLRVFEFFADLAQFFNCCPCIVNKSQMKSPVVAIFELLGTAQCSPEERKELFTMAEISMGITPINPTSMRMGNF